MPINTDDIAIVNYCHSYCKPLMNIVRLPKDEAFALATAMARDNPETTAFYRFADFVNYYDLRMRQDKYLRELFISMGGKPVEQHPLSFVLKGSEYLDEWFGKGRTLRFFLKDIPSHAVSFTLGDSGSTYQHTGGVRMLTKDELIGYMSAYKGTLDEYLKELLDGRHYVEVQVWDDRYILNQREA